MIWYLFKILINDVYSFYERRRGHLDNKHPSSNGWRKNQKLTTEIEKRMVLYSKNITIIQNQPNQQAIDIDCDYWWPPIAKLANIPNYFLIKKIITCFFWSFDFVLVGVHSIHCTHRICQLTSEFKYPPCRPKKTYNSIPRSSIN